MQYILLIYNKENFDVSEAEMAAEMEGYNAFTKEVRDRGLMVAGEALHPVNTATTVRVRDGKSMITDGPFAETHEQLGGFYILDCKNLDEATEMAAKIPGARKGSIEVRPIMVFE